jgi:hypothetical protein
MDKLMQTRKSSPLWFLYCLVLLGLVVLVRHEIREYRRNSLTRNSNATVWP